LFIQKNNWLKYVVHAKKNDWLESVVHAKQLLATTCCSYKTVTDKNLLWTLNDRLESVVHRK